MDPQFPPSTAYELSGWELIWHRLLPDAAREARLDALWSDEHRALRGRFSERALIDEPIVPAVRHLFREGGCDPTRYRPSSEALARRVLRGDELPRINDMVDLNNLLSLRLLAPCCVIDARAVEPPLVLRAGGAGERMASMRGDFNLENKVLLADRQGPFGTPITDSERVKVGGDAGECWMVAYVPEGFDGAVMVAAAVADLDGGIS